MFAGGTFRRFGEFKAPHLEVNWDAIGCDLKSIPTRCKIGCLPLAKPDLRHYLSEGLGVD
jgi:hypothetical protein